ncbi:MAG: hypothetical protein ACD_41C00004G0002 [uncultured bacterium]|nr:MAG: hypothetical protein ACD_41C00004G0002 [uncultured bacterium]
MGMKQYQLIAGWVSAWLVAMVPFASQAFTVDSVVMSDDATDVVTDISDFIPANPSEDMVMEMTGFSYTADTGSATYTATFTVTDDADELDTAPFVMAPGADISSFTVESLGDNSYQYSVTFTTSTLYIPDQGVGQQFLFVFIGTVENPSPENPEPGNGPPAAMSGGYIATTVQEFQMVPPSGPGDAQFGVILSGPSGTSGFFKMKFPAGMLELMSTMSGKTIDASNLAVFVDNDQASTTVTATEDGGVLMDIQVTFAEGSTDTLALSPLAANVSKEIVAKEQLPLSSAFLSSSVKQTERASLYGWKKSSYANKSVKIYRKKAGTKKFALVDTVMTDDDGYYEYNFKAKKLQLKNGSYVFKAVSGGVTSPKQTLVVTK